jgi:hypothetical protein
MADLVELETRLIALEQDVVRLKSAAPSGPPSPDWVDDVSGSMKAYPEFDEVTAIGKAARQADRSSDAAGNAA